jgi:hypothetical protein
VRYGRRRRQTLGLLSILTFGSVGPLDRFKGEHVRSERAGQRVMESIARFVTQRLKLKVNEAKCAVARPQERKFLGFSFTAGPEVKRVIAPKALDRFKWRVREITRRAKGVSVETTIEELAPYMGVGAAISASAKRLGADLPHPLGPVATTSSLWRQ